MGKQPLTLAHPAVQAAKAKFDGALKRGTPRKHTLTFEELFEYFRSDCVRQIRVAELTGLTRERIRQIYNKYFRELFDAKSGIERRQANTLESRVIKTKQVGNDILNSHAVLKAVTESARGAGCVVEAVSRGFPRWPVSTTALCINGHICSVHALSNCFKGSNGKREYTRSQLSLTMLETTEAAVFYSQVNDYAPAIFVVPTVLLRETFFGSSKQKKMFFLPLEKLPSYNGMKTRIDWWEHKEAWHLLP